MRAYAAPMLVTQMGQDSQQCSALQPLPLTSNSAGGGYSEKWLQDLIQQNPALLPIDQIEPGLWPIIPVCIELPVPSGFADNLLMTPDGGLVLIEAKLWRNPQARREVVGQVLDYAKDLAKWSYEDLQRAVGIARGDKVSLFQLVCSDAEADAEARFVDAVSRNLRLGRFLLIIAGDGIQESAEQLVDFLQRHIGLHFTLAMVEMSLWRSPTSGDIFVQPKVITRTVQIERAVIRLEDGVALQPGKIEPASVANRPGTLSSEAFYEALRRTDPALPERLQAFLTEVEALGVRADIKRNLSLKWRSAEGRDFSLGNIDLDGRLGTDFAHAATSQIGRLDLSHAYQAELAGLIPGATIRKTPNPAGWRAVLGADNLPVTALLSQRDAWVRAVAAYVEALQQAIAA